jgi:hypothetical protein
LIDLLAVPPLDVEIINRHMLGFHDGAYLLEGVAFYQGFAFVQLLLYEVGCIFVFSLWLG